MRNSILIYVFLISACASAPAINTNNDPPQPYHTATPAATSTPNVLVIVETPLPTATPFIYTIQSGDTFSQLAEKFNISQDDLRNANPDVSPNSMPVGATLLIPDPSSALAGASTPTPVPAPVTQTVCHPSADSGLWCFALIQNNTAETLENISAQITLFDENKNLLASETAFPPLDIIPPGRSLPVYVFFPNTPADVEAQVQLLSAYPSNNPRYLPAQLNNTIAQIDWNGRTAQLSGQILLPADSPAASEVLVAAVAYDKEGRVVGVRRWDGGAIPPGGSISFSFSVSSLGSAIDTVDFILEAK